MEEIVLNYDHVIHDLHAAVVQRQVDGSSINMLIMKSDCQAQRLISFDLPEDHCTLADLLKRVNLLHLQNHYRVFLMSHPSIQANYLVLFDEEAKNEIEKNLEVLFSNTETNILQNEVSTAPPTNTVSKAPKYINGMLAVCPFCGITAEDFNYCVRCKRKLPDKVKAVVISNDLNSKKEKYVLIENQGER